MKKERIMITRRRKGSELGKKCSGGGQLWSVYEQNFFLKITKFWEKLRKNFEKNWAKILKKNWAKILKKIEQKFWKKKLLSNFDLNFPQKVPIPCTTKEYTRKI